MIASGSAVHDASIRILLVGADLETDAKMQTEVERWAALLLTLRDHPDLRQVTTEALVLRGLPEATVVLAVATVAESSRLRTAPLEAATSTNYLPICSGLISTCFQRIRPLVRSLKSEGGRARSS